MTLKELKAIIQKAETDGISEEFNLVKQFVKGVYHLSERKMQ